MMLETLRTRSSVAVVQKMDETVRRLRMEFSGESCRCKMMWRHSSGGRGGVSDVGGGK